MKKYLTTLSLFVVCFGLNSFVFGQNSRSPQFVQQTKSIVKIARAEVFSDGNGAWLHWQAEFESGNLGFNIYRVTDQETVRVNQNMIGGASLSSRDEIIYGTEYSFFDRNGTPGTTYYIESLGTNGKRRNVYSTRAEYVSDLTPLAGVSSKFLQNAAQTAKPNVLENDLILPPELQDEINTDSPASDLVMQRWVANQPGVKIGVREKGLYRVTRTELENAGFNVNSDPNSWQLYLDGIEQSINVAPNGNYIEFYGRTVNILQTNTRIYFLINGTQNGKRIGSKIIRPIGGNVVGKTYNNSFTKAERLYYLNDHLNGETENFYGTVITSTAGIINFDLSAIDFRNGNTDITVSAAGVTLNSHLIDVKLNGNLLGQMSWSGRTSKSQVFSIPYQMLQEGTNTLNMVSVTSANDVLVFDSVKVDYPRRYAAEQDKLAFYTNNLKVSNITGFSSDNVRLYDVTFPDTPQIVTNVPAISNGNGGFDLRIPANRAYLMYAVEDSAVLSAATIVRNFPSTLSSPANNADFVIIAHRDLWTAANNWAAYRATGGMNVKVVDVEDIYDEYSFGLMSSNAIRNFLQYAKNNWQTKPNYVMLMGDATYDPKNYTGNGYFNQVPTQMLDTVYIETGSDESLADFDNDGLAELSIGRISTRTSAEATFVFDKTVHFETNLATAYARGFMFVSDLPNGYDFQGVSNRLRNELPTGTNALMVYRGDANSRMQVLDGWNTGKYLINWTGHGSSGLWASSSFFGSSDIAGMTNTDYTILTALTCLNGYFITPAFPSMSEVAIQTPNKAAVAAWASTGLTTPDIQEIMARRFFKKLGEGTIPRMGDLIRDAKTQIPGGLDVRLSWALFGDPTLLVRPLTPPTDRKESAFSEEDLD